MTYWEKPLVWLLTLLIDGTLLYTFSCVAFCQRPCARDWSLFLAATMVIDGINMLFLHGQFSGWSLLQGACACLYCGTVCFSPATQAAVDWLPGAAVHRSHFVVACRCRIHLPAGAGPCKRIDAAMAFAQVIAFFDAFAAVSVASPCISAAAATQVPSLRVAGEALDPAVGFAVYCNSYLHSAAIQPASHPGAFFPVKSGDAAFRHYLDDPGHMFFLPGAGHPLLAHEETE